MVLLDQGQELPDLVRLCLVSHWLEVQAFTDLGVPVDAMAASNSVRLEAARFDELLKVRELHVLQRAASEAAKEPPRVHTAG